MLTDNHILVDRHIELPTLMCAQRKAEKTIPDEEDFIKSNIDSFGNSIGTTTNWITSMFEVQSHFDKGSEEYEILKYRIMCGQLYQQNEIDKAKGIICKPMPKEWHDKYAANRIEDDEKHLLYRSIVVDKKPYFMRYIYPSLMKEYNTYIKNTNTNALREFQMTVHELDALPEHELTERQREFLKYFHFYMPVGIGNCVMNKICRLFEEEFDGYISKHSSEVDFDYNIMKSDEKYSQNQYYAIKRLYESYNNRLRNYMIHANYERVDKYEALAIFNYIDDAFRAECDKVCPNQRALCNIFLDLCYKKKSTKRLAWNMCGDEIIQNLLEKNDNIISYPTMKHDGEIRYCGKTFTLETKRIEVDNNNNTE